MDQNQNQDQDRYQDQNQEFSGGLCFIVNHDIFYHSCFKVT